MRNFIFAAAMLLLCVDVITAQQRADMDHSAANSMLQERGEVFFEFEIAHRSELSVLTRIISIDHVAQYQVKAYANQTQFAQFLELGYEYRLLTPPSMQQMVEMMEDTPSRDLNLTAYPTYTQYVSMMQNWVSSYPDLCRLQQIGTTADGRALLVLKITDNPDVREYEPQFLYTSTMHGDETAGYIAMLELIDHLLSNYPTNAEVAELVNSTEIWINPNANPDGTYAAGNNTVNGATRANGNNIDLNRNYPDPQDGPHPDGNAWQPETIAFMAFADSMDFVMACNFHGGAELFNYVWDTKAADHPDRNWWSDKGQEYVDDVHAVSGTGYLSDFQAGFDAPGLTNGFAWYEVNGGRQDYMNAFEYCREATLELSITKLIPTSDFASIWDYNRQALINYMKLCYEGFHGMVTDACTGQGLKARVFISGHDADSSHVYASLPLGNYYRPIAAGNYAVTFSAPGYISQTINNVQVGSNPLELMVALQPALPNPAFASDAGNSCGSAVQFTDLTGSASSWLWSFGDGSTSTEQNPYHVYTATGMYDVALTVTNCAGSNTAEVVNYIDATVTELPATSATELTSCQPASFSISASASGDIRWYDAQVGGNVLATGSSYTTPVITNSTTVYVENSLSSGTMNVGPLDNSIANGGYYTNNAYHYLAFDALSDFTLTSVRVFANSAGNRTIDLRDGSGNVLQSVTVNIPTGESVVDLQLSIAGGASYQLGTAGGNNLFRNQGGATFPYSVSGIVDITGTSASATNPSYYYYFYDWVIEQRCSSGRVPIAISILNSEPLQATIDVTSSTCTQNDLPVDVAAVVTSNLPNPTYSWLLDGQPVANTDSQWTESLPAGAYTIDCIVSSLDVCGAPASVNATTYALVITNVNTPIIEDQGGGILLCNEPGNVQWYFNGTPIVGATGSTLQALDNGSYSAMVTNGDCSASSESIDVIVFSVSERNQATWVVYPNPAADVMMIHCPSGNRSWAGMYDGTGRLITRFQLLDENTTLSVSDLTPGVYTLEVSGIVQRILIR